MIETRRSGSSDEQLTGSVLKALSILDCFARRGEPLTPAEIAQEVGTSRPTAYRLLATLARGGWVVHDAQNPSRYRLGHKILQIAGAYLEDLNLWEVAKPTMEELSNRCHETVKLWAYDGLEVVYLGRVTGPGPVQSVLPVGSRGSLHSRAVGKAILACLPDSEIKRLVLLSGLEPRTSRTITDLDRLLQDLAGVRERGYAMSDEEDVEGLRAVGAAILNLEGAPVGGLVISNMVIHMNDQRLAALGEALLEGCLRVSRMLGYAGPT